MRNLRFDTSILKGLTLKHLTLICLLFSAACAQGQTSDTATSITPETYLSQLTDDDKQRMPQWLINDCRGVFKKEGQYQKCLAVETSQLPPLDLTRREHFGEHYSPERYFQCRIKTARNNMSCHIHKLRRAENPAYWPYPDIPPPQLPEPPNPPVYKTGMTPKQYFEALCKAEAGDFIYKTVEDVEGIYQIRPQQTVHQGSHPRIDRYVMEDPYGYEQWLSDHPQNVFVREGKYYEFLETSAAGRLSTDSGVVRPLESNAEGHIPGAKFYRYYEIPPFGSDKRQMEGVIEIKSRYGYYWRGIPRPHDREMAIAGGELIILDLKTNEILAIHRGFNLNGKAPNPSRIYWGTGPLCPVQKDYSLRYQNFINRVLKPKGSQSKP